MGNAIKIDGKTINLDDEIKKILEDYKNQVEKNVDDEAKKVAKLGAQKLKSSSPKNKGKYAKSWNWKKIGAPLGHAQYTVYNAKHYRLTHLLENGHLIRNQNGTYGRTKARPHIKPVEIIVQDEFFNKLKQKL